MPACVSCQSIDGMYSHSGLVNSCHNHNQVCIHNLCSLALVVYVLQLCKMCRMYKMICCLSVCAQLIGWYPMSTNSLQAKGFPS